MYSCTALTLSVTHTKLTTSNVLPFYLKTYVLLAHTAMYDNGGVFHF